jgi:hypothetical protein
METSASGGLPLTSPARGPTRPPPARLVHFATHHAGDGRALRYHFDEFMLAWVRGLVDELSQRPQFHLAGRFIEEKVLRLYLLQALGIELHAAGHAIFRAKLAAERGDFAAPVPILPMLAPLVRKSVDHLGVRIAASPRLHGRRVGLGLRRWMRQLLVRGNPSPAQRSDGRASIAVELVEGADPTGKCDAFWLAESAVDPARVLFVLEGSNRTLVDPAQQVRPIKRLGSRAVAVDPSMAVDGIPYWRPAALPGWASDLAASLPAASDGAERWLTATLRACSARVGFWEVFFREHAVQVVQNFTEFSPETVAKRIAIGRVGGIEVGKQRSQFFEKASAAFYFTHEVAFIWHRDTIRFLQSGQTGTEYVVETGYVYDYLATAMKSEAAALRRRLTERGASTVITLFDAGSHPNTHFTDDDLRAYYDVALALVEQREALGLIVKSKKPGIIPGYPDIAARIRRLVAAGRCLVIDRPLASMLPAALAADLALSFPASTAGCEAALAGSSVLMYDPSGSQEHPWVKAGDILLTDIDSLRSACATRLEQLIAGSASIDRKRRLELDPYLDGKAYQRAARFVAAFLESREAGFAKADSLAAAAAAGAIPLPGAERQ